VQRSTTETNLGGIARELFFAAIDHVSISKTLAAQIRADGDSLLICDLKFPLVAFDDFLIVAVGKAAGPMCDVVLDQLTPILGAGQRIRGVVVGATEQKIRDGRVIHFVGSHPLPDANSQLAAQVLLEELRKCSKTSFVLFLVSGGASSMVEEALDPAFTSADLIDFHRALVGSGLPITQMNALRKHFSSVKGGRLAVAADGATQCSLLISDVPDDQLHIIGSGPSLPDPSTVQDCRRIIDENESALGFSERILTFFSYSELPETPKESHPSFRRAHWRSLLSSKDLSERASKVARQYGFHVMVDNSCDDRDYRSAARYLVDLIETLRNRYPRVCLISVGEVSVQLPQRPGLGGRNQQFVLESARILAERSLPVTVLSGGSDGIDGNSIAAGAIADENTFRRASALGFEAVSALRDFSSYPLFQALGDTIVTGPTGTNVRDLRILMSVS
jgi:glycerate 2-kinase